jgi:hypothetical protein
MRYVILRDDDTNAFTPVDHLERLYRPFLDRGLPVNLATIPNVSTEVVCPDGKREGFLMFANGETQTHRPIGDNPALICYLRENSGYHIVQHGYDHGYFEFESVNRAEISLRLQRGARLLMDAGLPGSGAFVAPYDRFSRVSLHETAKYFGVISSGWFELSRLPYGWWPEYALKKALRRPHWRVGTTRLLTHPGCLLSYHHPYAGMLDEIKKVVAGRKLTVLVTHWWEYFSGLHPDDAFIEVLHQTAIWLASQPDIKVISFDDLIKPQSPVSLV